MPKRDVPAPRPAGSNPDENFTIRESSSLAAGAVEHPFRSVGLHRSRSQARLPRSGRHAHRPEHAPAYTAAGGDGSVRRPVFPNRADSACRSASSPWLRPETFSNA